MYILYNIIIIYYSHHHYRGKQPPFFHIPVAAWATMKAAPSAYSLWSLEHRSTVAAWCTWKHRQKNTWHIGI